IKISSDIASYSLIRASSGHSELDIFAPKGGAVVTLQKGILDVGGLGVNYRFGNTTAGSSTVTGLSDTTGLEVGQAINGPGFPNGTIITSIDFQGGSIILSSNAAVTASKAQLSFDLGFEKMVVTGGTGSNTFITDGSIPNVILKGGDGPNTTNLMTAVTAPGKTSTLIGGNGTHTTNTMKAVGGTSTLIGGSGQKVQNTMTALGGTSTLIGGSGQSIQNAMTVTGSTSTLSGGSGLDTQNTMAVTDGTSTLSGGTG